MTRQALAELSTLLAQRAVMASPSRVAKDALKLARYARAAQTNAENRSATQFLVKDSRLRGGASMVACAYNLSVSSAAISDPTCGALFLRALPNTPPIQGYPEGYAI